MSKPYRIGALARAAGVPVETIRYYELSGLMPSPRRSEGNFRLYTETQRERLVFIRQCRALDMTLDEIRRLLVFKDDPSQRCDAVNTLLEAHIRHISRRMAQLSGLKRDLQALRRRCGRRRIAADCAILAGLSSGTATQSRPNLETPAHPRTELPAAKRAGRRRAA